MIQVIKSLQEACSITSREAPERLDQKIQEILKGLTPEQAMMVYDYFVGPMRCLAIPGSGKTHTMIRLAMKLWLLMPTAIRSKPNVRIVTFTRKAATEARERLVAQVGGEAARSVTTFHALAIQIYMDDDKAKEFWTPKCTLADFTGWEGKKVIEKLIELKYSASGVDTSDVVDFWNFHVNNVGDFEDFQEIIYGDYSESSEEVSVICEIIGELLEMMQARNELPMDLVIPIAVSLLKLRRRGVCKYLIVDEFQDTNNAQFEFSVQLLKPFDNLCVVGDVHQCIYRWRGAKPENLEELFETRFPDVITHSLTLNFRSTQNILKAGSLVLPSFYEKEFPHNAASDETGPPVHFSLAEGPRREADLLVEWIREMRGKGVPYNEIMVLYRSGGFIPSLEKVLVKEGIPYILTKGTAFFSRKEVKDLVAYMQWSLSPRDFRAGQRVINWPRRGAGKKTIEGLNYNYTKAKWPRKLREFQNHMIHLHQKIKEEAIDPLEWVKYILYDIGLFNGYDKDDQRESFSVVMEWMIDFRNEKMTPLESINEMLTVATPPDDDEPRVQIMTIHGAKGLESKAVYICHAVEGNIPAHGGADIQEECHLMYVGITRAEEYLCISCPQKIFRYGELRNATPSRFLNHVFEGLTQGREMTIFRDTTNFADHYGGGGSKRGRYRGSRRWGR